MNWAKKNKQLCSDLFSSLGTGLWEKIFNPFLEDPFEHCYRTQKTSERSTARSLLCPYTSTRPSWTLRADRLLALSQRKVWVLALAVLWTWCSLQRIVATENTHKNSGSREVAPSSSKPGTFWRAVCQEPSSNIALTTLTGVDTAGLCPCTHPWLTILLASYLQKLDKQVGF